MSRFDVSIVIPTYNRAERLLKAVRSCSQDGISVEVIVVDDGSSDNTDSMLREAFPQDDGSRDDLAHSTMSLKILKQQRSGPAAARNLGLRNASADLVKFLDSDDELIRGALIQEVEHARATGADAVVTGWEERAGTELLRAPSAPDLSRGIDDMLQGKAPWTAAGLYRRAFIKDLEWLAADGKADDWGWAWTVCLAGARFARLEINSAIWVEHDSDRITTTGDSFQKSTDARQAILARVETALAETGRLTPERRHLLARYYCKDAKVICSRSRAEWTALWKHCCELAPGFVPKDSDRLTTVLSRWTGHYRAVIIYTSMRRLARSLGLRRH